MNGKATSVCALLSSARKVRRFWHAKRSIAPGGIRTHGLRFRKPSLYPAELRARHMQPSITHFLGMFKLENPLEAPLPDSRMIFRISRRQACSLSDGFPLSPRGSSRGFYCPIPAKLLPRTGGHPRGAWAVVAGCSLPQVGGVRRVWTGLALVFVLQYDPGSTETRVELLIISPKVSSHGWLNSFP